MLYTDKNKESELYSIPVVARFSMPDKIGSEEFLTPANPITMRLWSDFQGRIFHFSVIFYKNYFSAGFGLTGHRKDVMVKGKHEGITV